MKKYLIMVTVCLVSGMASGATSGFTTECDICVQYVSCVAQKVMADLSKYNCSQLSSSEFKNYSEASAVNACKSSYPSMQIPENFGQLGRRLVQEYMVDECNLSDIYLSLAKIDYANAVIASCYERAGYCKCNVGSYILSRGVTPGQWAVNAECVPCPAGGTSSFEVPIGLESCYIPAGAFSDSTGAGVYTADCAASYDSDQERLDAYK